MANLVNLPSVLGNSIRQAAATAEAAAFGGPFDIRQVSTGVDTIPATAFGQRAELVIQGQGTATLTVPASYSAILNQADTQTIDVTGTSELSYEGETAGQTLKTAVFESGTIAMTGGGNKILSNSIGNRNLIVTGIVDPTAASYELAPGATAGDNVIALGGSDATVAAGVGDNVIFMANGHALVVSEGADTIVGGSNAGTIVASGTGVLVFDEAGPVSFVNGGGAATVIGGAGSATLSGGSGSLVVFGGSGQNVAYGGSAGNNVMVSELGAMTMTGGGGFDQLYANGGGGDLLAASGGKATLSAAGSTGGNVLFGGSGDDLMVAGAGNDTMVAGTGTATIFGTARSDATTDVFAGVGSGEFVAGSGREFIQGGSGTLNVFEGGGHAEFGLTRGSAGGVLNIYGFKAASDVFHLTGYGAADPLANVSIGSGPTSLTPSTSFTLSDNTRVTLVNTNGLTGASFV